MEEAGEVEAGGFLLGRLHGGGGWEVTVSISVGVVVVLVVVVFGDGVDAERAVGHVGDNGLITFAECEVSRRRGRGLL